AQMIWCAIIIILAPTTDPFTFLVSLSQYTILIGYGAASVGLLHLRYIEPGLDRPTPVPKPVVYAFLLMIALILIAPFTKESSELPYVISICVIGLAVTAWYWKYYVWMSRGYAHSLSLEPEKQDSEVETESKYEESNVISDTEV
ncbi:13090_t:CDS:2, partial [Ambispora gerdemannii]